MLIKTAKNLILFALIASSGLVSAHAGIVQSNVIGPLRYNLTTNRQGMPTRITLNSAAGFMTQTRSFAAIARTSDTVNPSDIQLQNTIQSEITLSPVRDGTGRSEPLEANGTCIEEKEIIGRHILIDRRLVTGSSRQSLEEGHPVEIQSRAYLDFDGSLAIEVSRDKTFCFNEDGQVTSARSGRRLYIDLVVTHQTPCAGSAVFRPGMICFESELLELSR